MVFGHISIDRSAINHVHCADSTAIIPWRDIERFEDLRQGTREPPHSIAIRATVRPKHREISLDGRPNGIFMPDLLYHAAACSGIPLDGFGPAGWRIDEPAESSPEGS